MLELSKSNFGLRLRTAVFLVVAATSSSSHAQKMPTQAERALQFREAQGMSSALGAQRRTHLAGEIVVRPTVVQAPVGTTVVTRTTAVNPGRVVGVGSGATAAQLDVRCPFAGGRVVMHGNRVINIGDITASGQDSTAAQVVKRCSADSEADLTTQTTIQNYGRVRAAN